MCHLMLQRYIWRRFLDFIVAREITERLKVSSRTGFALPEVILELFIRTVERVAGGVRYRRRDGAEVVILSREHESVSGCAEGSHDEEKLHHAMEETAPMMTSFTVAQGSSAVGTLVTGDNSEVSGSCML